MQQPTIPESDLEPGYIFAPTEKPKVCDVRSEGERIGMLVLTDNCADEHACSQHDFPWVNITPSRNPNLAVADGSPLKHYGQKMAAFYIEGNRMVILESQVTDV